MAESSPTTVPGSMYEFTNTSSTPELPGGSLYLLIGGASGMLFWVRRFFRK